MITVNTQGRNRLVLLTRRYAVKIPSLRSWRDFLFGLLNNLNEARFHREDPDKRCPVLFSAPGGWLLIMPRVTILREDEMQEIDVDAWFANRPGSPEPKADSFGRHGDEIVAVDYGW